MSPPGTQRHALFWTDAIASISRASRGLLHVALAAAGRGTSSATPKTEGALFRRVVSREAAGIDMHVFDPFGVPDVKTLRHQV